jgi:hypothetical protein
LRCMREASSERAPNENKPVTTLREQHYFIEDMRMKQFIALTTYLEDTYHTFSPTHKIEASVCI